MKNPVLIFRTEKKMTADGRVNLEKEIQRQMVGTALEGVRVVVLSDCDDFQVVTEPS